MNNMLQRHEEFGVKIGQILILYMLCSISALAIPTVSSHVVKVEYITFIFIAMLMKRVKREYIFVFFTIMANEAVASYWGITVFHMNPLQNISSPLAFSCVMMTSLGINWSSSITKSDVAQVFSLLFILGIVACIYAMTAQNEVLRTVLEGGDPGMRYISFLGHRNQFGGIVYIATIGAMYMWHNNRKNLLYPVFIAIFFLNIKATDSRTAFFSVVMFAGLYFIFRKRIPIKFLMLIGIPVLIIAAMIGLRYSDILTSKLFAHKSGTGLESESRFLIWAMMLAKMYEHGAFLSGFGANSQQDFIRQRFYVTNAHNAFMDMLFTGGIVKLSVYIISLVIIYKKICKHPDVFYKDFMKAAFWSYVFYSSFDNVSTLFASSFVSLTATIIFAILPQYRK